MAEFYADDRARERRLADIRARRGTPEREAALAEIAAKKEQDKKAAAKRKSTGATVRKTRENSTEYHGHAWDEWDRMRDLGHDFIVERAAKREFTPTAELWEHLTTSLGKPLGNSHFQIPALLEHIALKSLDGSDLMVTALVQQDNAEPGVAFFRLAAAKGLLPAADAPGDGKDWTMSDAQRAFWQNQTEAVFAKYAAG